MSDLVIDGNSHELLYPKLQLLLTEPSPTIVFVFRTMVKLLLCVETLTSLSIDQIDIRFESKYRELMKKKNILHIINY